MNDLFSKTVFDEKSLTWRGGECPTLFNSRITVGTAAWFVLNQNPDFVAQISDNSGVRKTNREIRDAMLRIAVNLGKIGCSKGDVVGFLSSNNEEVGSAVLATLLLAAQVNALDPAFGKDEIAHMFGITRPKFIFCESDKIPVLIEALLSLDLNAKIIAFGEKVQGFLHIGDLLNDPGSYKHYDFPEIDEKTCAIIICSSGTTGMPKGVCVPHRTLLYLAAYGIVAEPQKPLSILCFSSLYWYTGILTLLTGTIQGITRIITSDPYTPDLFYNMILKHRPNLLFTGPVQLTGILNHPLLDESTMDSIKHFVVTGSGIPEPLWKEAKKFLRNGDIYCGYGMSEVGWISREPKKALRQSVGFLVAGVQMKIVDEVSNKLGIRQQGEICMKFKDSILGYYNNPEATANMLDEDGWIHSGDLGYFDEDNLLHVVGRNKDILKYNNFHVPPIELENIILTHPDVLQAVVVGVPHPISRDLPAAVIVRKKGSLVTEKDIKSMIEKSLSDPKHLRGGVYFVDNLPLTPSGKIKRIIVKDIATKLYKERIL